MSLSIDTLNFIQRWLDKASRYENEKLEDYFDRFFSVFVLYNFLYCLINEQNGYNKKKDSEAAVYVAKKYLGASKIYEDESLKADALRIKELINEGSFYIRDSVWDKSKIKKIESNDPEQWSKGILEIVYKIRCNTFHGSKSFSEDQKVILQPCINIIGRICILIIEELDANKAVDTTRYTRFAPSTSASL